MSLTELTRHPVTDDKILHVELRDDVPAEFLRTGSPRHDAGLDVTHVWLGPASRVQHVDKHGGSPVDGGALLGLDGRHTGGSVKAGAGNHAGGAVNNSSQSGADVTEAVIEGDGDTDSVWL